MATPTEVPPKPTKPPTVHLKGVRRTPPRTLKGDLRKLRNKAADTRRKWVDGRAAAEEKKKEVRKKAQFTLGPVRDRAVEEGRIAGEAMKPIQKAVVTARVVLSRKNRKTKPYVDAFFVAFALSWALSPQMLLAAYDRIVLMAGRPLIAPARDASVLEAGRGTDWGILHGPGRWVRDTVRMAYETGQMGALVWAAVLGMLPMIILGIRNGAATYLSGFTYQGKLGQEAVRRLTQAAYAVPVVYLVGVAYPNLTEGLFGATWTLAWWQVWVTALVCVAYYSTMWALDRIERIHQERQMLSEEERDKLGNMRPDFFHILLMIPVASLFGALLHAPGAAW